MYEYNLFRNVKRFITHELYEPPNTESLNDLGLIKVDREFELEHTKPACLPAAGFVNEYRGTLMVSFQKARLCY